MAVREITDDKPRHWTFKGGRHNAMSRHWGEHGLWYLRETIGSGRYMSGWALHVFPDSVTISGYAGRNRSRVLTEALASHCLLSVSGRGGYDFGKSITSKGGYRQSRPISYIFKEKGEFDQALLDDGDEFLRQVLGYEPTPQGVRDGVVADAKQKKLKEAEKKTKEEAWMASRQTEREAKEKARQQAKAEFEIIFAEVNDVPTEYQWEITPKGLRVFRGWIEIWRRYCEDVYLTTIEAYQAWLQEAKAKLQTEAREAEKRAQECVREEAERQVKEAQVIAEKAVIEEHLQDLDDLLSNL